MKAFCCKLDRFLIQILITSCRFCYKLYKQYYCPLVIIVLYFQASNAAGRTSGAGLEDVSSNGIVEVFETVKKHQDYLAGCEDLFGELNVNSCFAVVKDLVDLNVVVANISAQSAIIYADGIKIVTKFNTCGLKLSISSKVKCLASVYNSTQALVTRATEEFSEFQTDITNLVEQIKTDVKSCSSGLSNKRLETLLSKCKSRFV